MQEKGRVGSGYGEDADAFVARVHAEQSAELDEILKRNSRNPIMQGLNPELRRLAFGSGVRSSLLGVHSSK